MAINAGRHRAATQDELVVFLIGMRFSRPLHVRRWLPVVRAMPRMLRELRAAPTEETGFLHAELGVVGAGPLVVQYWRSFADLERYARDADAEHLPAWRAFNAAARAGEGAAGVWHETYRVRAGEHEQVYVDVPALGLGKAVGTVPVGSASRAATRIGAREEEADAAAAPAV